jgi:hypothetical protein
MLSLKEDWPAAQRRFIAWWQGAVLDRPGLQVTAPRSDIVPQPVLEPPTLYEC